MNKRSNHVISYNGISLPITAWAEKIGIKPITLFKRIDAGWSAEKALTEPVKHKR